MARYAIKQSTFCMGYQLKAGETVEIPDEVAQAVGVAVAEPIGQESTEPKTKMVEGAEDKMIKKAKHK